MSHQATARTLRAARHLPLCLAAWVVTGCTGTSTGTPDPGAAGRAGDQAQQFALSNGKLIGAIIIALVGTTFLAFVWRSAVTKILLALVVGGAVVYYATGGGR